MTDAFQAVAVDVGASNGRALLGTLAGSRLEIEELRRFPNRMVESGGSLVWDFERLRDEVLAAVAGAVGPGRRPVSVGVDTWGVDYVLFDAQDRPMAPVFAYRDGRTGAAMERFLSRVMDRRELYALTGIQFLQFNTLYQLAAEIWSGAGRLDRAERLLLMPDALGRALGARPAAEYTIASTTQMLDARRRSWSEEVLGRLRLRRSLLPEIVEPGARLGRHRTPSGAELEVAAVAGHDTGSAVAAVPAEPGAPWAYVSSGTWSLVGVEAPAPVLSEAARRAGLTNEGGAAGTIRLLKNVMGLWLIQECQRRWQRDGQAADIEEVCRAAAAAPAGGPLVDPDDGRFFAPADMPAEIGEFCRRTGQRPPEGVGATARCVFESLALKTRAVLELIAEVTGAAPQVLHVVGGGARNALLCRMTAEACALPVVAGPAEATATGNLLVQAMAAGRLASLAELREVVRGSFRLERYEPSGDERWAKRYARFRELSG